MENRIQLVSVVGKEFLSNLNNLILARRIFDAPIGKSLADDDEIVNMVCVELSKRIEIKNNAGRFYLVIMGAGVVRLTWHAYADGSASMWLYKVAGSNIRFVGDGAYNPTEEIRMYDNETTQVVFSTLERGNYGCNSL